MDTDTRQVSLVGMRAFNNVEHGGQNGGQTNATLLFSTKEFWTMLHQHFASVWPALYDNIEERNHNADHGQKGKPIKINVLFTVISIYYSFTAQKLYFFPKPSKFSSNTFVTKFSPTHALSIKSADLPFFQRKPSRNVHF